MCLAWRSSSVSEHLYTFDMKYEVSSLTRTLAPRPSLPPPPPHRSPAPLAAFMSALVTRTTRLISLPSAVVRFLRSLVRGGGARAVHYAKVARL